ncbi:MAG: hypothetical protein H7Y02_06700 [Candidatus Obscuribacterales bacterium]|nr:hypothetical protein [Steroidobacteraceae bacterium]
MIDCQGSHLEGLAAAMHALALAYPSEDLSPLSPLVGFNALPPEGQTIIDQHSGLLGEDYYAHIRRGIAAGTIRNIDVEARALMLPGLLSWLVKDDVPTDLEQRRQIAHEIANLVAVGLLNHRS